MKATLIFDLPEERPEYMLANRAGDLHSALHEVAEHIRSRLKYEALTAEAREALETVRALIPGDLLDL